MTDNRKIAKRYIRGWFFVDLTASIPVEIVIYYWSIGATGAVLMLMRVLRLARLFRLRQLWQFVSRIQHTNALRLVRLFFLFILVAHWTACLFYGAAKMEMCVRCGGARCVALRCGSQKARTVLAHR